MASKMLVPIRASSQRIFYGRFQRKSSELFLKRNLSQFKQNLKEVESHAGETYVTWRKISIFVAVPVCTYLFYKHMIVGEHMEPPKEFIAYDHIRMRKKPFPWGDGDKSLFHNEKFNVGPDTDFEEEEEHNHHEQEPIITRWFRSLMPKREDMLEWRDKHLRQMQIVAVGNLEFMEQPRKPPVPIDVFGIYDRSPKPKVMHVDH
ncbi:cytochrome c oxidase subunit 6A, mitochondrial-like [Rhopilema esculentum]|uniref:cytochrome c oxidase subunit 6A, mitochondrial-like n=1 Tax=Rhopilema esculentum TaxID=499914 RepID=UPI0031D79F1A